MNELTQALIKMAAEEVLNSPLAKTASENDIMSATAEYLLKLAEEAEGVMEAAAEVAEQAEAVEEEGREALEDEGIDPDEFIAAVEENMTEEEIEEQKEAFNMQFDRFMEKQAAAAAAGAKKSLKEVAQGVGSKIKGAVDPRDDLAAMKAHHQTKKGLKGMYSGDELKQELKHHRKSGVAPAARTAARAGVAAGALGGGAYAANKALSPEEEEVMMAYATIMVYENELEKAASILGNAVAAAKNVGGKIGAGARAAGNFVNPRSIITDFKAGKHVPLDPKEKLMLAARAGTDAAALAGLGYGGVQAYNALTAEEAMSPEEEEVMMAYATVMAYEEELEKYNY